MVERAEGVPKEMARGAFYEGSLTYERKQISSKNLFSFFVCLFLFLPFQHETTIAIHNLRFPTRNSFPKVFSRELGYDFGTRGKFVFEAQSAFDR